MSRGTPLKDRIKIHSSGVVIPISLHHSRKVTSLAKTKKLAGRSKRDSLSLLWMLSSFASLKYLSVPVPLIVKNRAFVQVLVERSVEPVLKEPASVVYASGHAQSVSIVGCDA